MKVKASILAIGNEVIEGQITNRNAAWLSQELEKMGVENVFHLSCRDYAPEIQEGLDYLAKNSDLIIASGGLGPTKDDRTRNVLAKWCQTDLEFNNDLWETISTKLTSRGVTLRDGHKQQAFIPNGSIPLANSKGVAPGFFMKTEATYLASLPGPPVELQAMFNEELRPLILNNLKPKSDLKLYTMVCLGAPESEIAHIAESIIGDKLELGFRLHKPFVEVKIWAQPQLDKNTQKLFETLRTKLHPWLISDSIENIRNSFFDKTKSFDRVIVIDQLTEGLFLDRVNEIHRLDNIRYQCFETKSLRFFKKDEVEKILNLMGQQEGQMVLGVFPSGPNSAMVSKDNEVIEMELPRNIPITSLLGKLYISEKLILSVAEFTAP